MARLLTPDAHCPILTFRFLIESDSLPNIKYYGKSTDLPKWTTETQWQNLIKMNCYHFENITVNELSALNLNDSHNMNIKILAPDETVIYEWQLIGNVIKIDYGKMDRSFEDVTMAEISFMPSDCVVAFNPN
jgi:hypothetical protein